MTLLSMLRSTDDPEARPRLYRAYQRATMLDLQALLPDDTPYWPDYDCCPFPRTERGEYLMAFGCFPIVYENDGEYNDPGFHQEYRRQTCAYLYEYVLRTGDLSFPAWALWYGRVQESAVLWKIPSVVELWWLYPDLMKGYYR